MKPITILSSRAMESVWLAESVEHTLRAYSPSLISLGPRNDGAEPARALAPALGISRRRELEAARELQSLTAEVLVCTDPELLTFAAENLPPEVALVTPRLAFPEVLDSVEHLFELADTVSTMDLDTPPEPWDIGDPDVVMMWAPAHRTFEVEAIIRTFIESGRPAMTLRVGVLPAQVQKLRQLTDRLGIHGMIEIFDLTTSSIKSRNRGGSVLVLGHDSAISHRLARSATANGLRPFTYSGDHASLSAWFTEALPLHTDSNVNPPFAETNPAVIAEEVALWRHEGTRRHQRIDRLAPTGSVPPTESSAPESNSTAANARTLEQSRVPQANPESAWLKRPNMIRWGGTVNVVRDECPEPDIIVENAALLSTLLSNNGLEHLLLNNDHEPTRFAVSRTAFPQLLHALRDVDVNRPLYVESLDKSKRILARQAAQVVDPPAGTVALRVFTPVVTSGRTLRYSGAHGATVELWDVSDDRPGYVSPYLRSPRGAHLISLVADASLAIRGTNVPTRRHALTTAIDEIDFPIDAVWTWVDGSDPQWQKKRSQYDTDSTTSNDGVSLLRFESRDELKYSLRSVHMYAPWIRTIYIVTDGQKPDWLVENERVRVIDHRDIIDAQYLPTFNSHVIENNLHHIDGLSDHYLYFNDDVFLGRRLRANDFFTSAGHSRVFTSPSALPEGPIDDWDHAYYASRKNNRDLIRSHFDREVVFGYLHTPHSLQKSLMSHIETEFAPQWERTNRNRFRSDLDLAVASSLHHDVGKLLGSVVDGNLASRYIRIGTPESIELFRALLARRYLDVFCLNDTRDAVFDEEVTDASVHAFLSAYFPVRAPWEKS